MLFEAGVECFGDCLAVEVLSDEDYFLHTVAILGIPVAHESGVGCQHTLEFILRGGGIPLSGVGQLLLHASLFEKIRHVGVVGEVADTFCAYHALWPVFGNEPVKLVNVESLPAVVYEGADAIFLCLTLSVMMVMTMAYAMLVITVRMVMIVMMMS